MKPKKKPTAINRTIATMQHELKQRRAILNWIKKHRELFEHLSANEIEGQFWGGNVDFNCLPHKAVVKVMRTFKAGTWKKTPSVTEARVDYSAQFDGVTIRCYAGEPPPNCKIVEEIVMIPARSEVVRKLVCPKNVIAA